MSQVDKNQAVIDYIIKCPTIKYSPLYFNFINAEDGNNQFVTQTQERYASKRYVDGSVMKIYSFTIILYKSTADIAVVKLDGYPNENISDMSDIQALIDWIREQNNVHNYPDFGEDCIIDEISTTTENPSFDGIDDQVSPPLAIYSVTIEIQYLDVSEKLWR
jgi:hypothetical protein